ncbi:MAG: hypothetical protein GY822_25810 [Deltaproteobacteria bacterium]|nr:hypothetical protein [Deltaproteobacteria bacterium]
MELLHQDQRCGEVDVVVFPPINTDDFRVVVEDPHSGAAVPGELFLRITDEPELR